MIPCPLIGRHFQLDGCPIGQIQLGLYDLGLIMRVKLVYREELRDLTYLAKGATFFWCLFYKTVSTSEFSICKSIC